MVSLLALHGHVEVGATSRGAPTYLHMAAGLGNLPMLELLVSLYRQQQSTNTSKTSKILPASLIDAPDASGATALLVAAKQGHIECVRLLLDVSPIVSYVCTVR